MESPKVRKSPDNYQSYTQGMDELARQHEDAGRQITNRIAGTLNSEELRLGFVTWN